MSISPGRLATNRLAAYTCIRALAVRHTYEALVKQLDALIGRLGLLSFFSLVAFFALTFPSETFSASCHGPNPEPHPYGTFTFHTNSRLDPIAQGNFRYGVISCVDHNDPLNDLKVHWLIPGPHGWVPPAEILESVPRMRIDDKVSQLKGCILYGERGDTTSGTFFGIDGDERRVEDEAKRGCRAAVESGPPSPSGIGDILLKIKNFFPSDARNPKNTMLQLDGSVGIKRTGIDSYSSFFEYEVKPYANSRGSVENVSVRPVFRGAAEGLLSSFNKYNGESRRLEAKGRISFEVFGVNSPLLAYASYDLYEQDNQLVGGIDFPVFVPKR